MFLAETIKTILGNVEMETDTETCLLEHGFIPGELAQEESQKKITKYEFVGVGVHPESDFFWSTPKTPIVWVKDRGDIRPFDAGQENQRPFEHKKYKLRKIKPLEIVKIEKRPDLNKRGLFTIFYR